MEPWSRPLAVDEAPTATRAQLEQRPIPEIEHYELDGIPLFHLPMEGSTVLGLSFGVGRAHEPFTRGGMTHMAEHLVMHAVSPDTYDHSNGVTEPFRVSFLRRGSPRDVSRFLADVCKAIEVPKVGRIGAERVILTTEAVGRGSAGIESVLNALRFGYQGLGSWGLAEFFVRDPDEKVLKTWMRDHLVAGNAVIWIAGELPDDLYVSLAPGPATPLPEAIPLKGLNTPTRIGTPFISGAAASFFTERSAAMSVALQVLYKRAMKALRTDRALAYSIGTDSISVGPDRAVSAVWAPCLDRFAADVERYLLESIDEVATRGCTEEDLDRVYSDFLRSVTEPTAVPGMLDAHVRDWLLGRRDHSAADLAREFARLTPDDVARAFEKARDTMILIVPLTSPDPYRKFKPFMRTPQESMGRGESFKQDSAKVEKLWAKILQPKLTIGDRGMAIDSWRGTRLVAIRWSECIGVVQDPGARSVFSSDGTQIRVQAMEWQKGGIACRLIDKWAPEGVTVAPDPTGLSVIARPE
jgi:hypothetical protein